MLFCVFIIILGHCVNKIFARYGSEENFVTTSTPQLSIIENKSIGYKQSNPIEFVNA